MLRGDLNLVSAGNDDILVDPKPPTETFGLSWSRQQKKLVSAAAETSWATIVGRTIVAEVSWASIRINLIERKDGWATIVIMTIVA